MKIKHKIMETLLVARMAITATMGATKKKAGKRPPPLTNRMLNKKWKL